MFVIIDNLYLRQFHLSSTPELHSFSFKTSTQKHRMEDRDHALQHFTQLSNNQVTSLCTLTHLVFASIQHKLKYQTEDGSEEHSAKGATIKTIHTVFVILLQQGDLNPFPLYLCIHYHYAHKTTVRLKRKFLEYQFSPSCCSSES